MSWVAGRQISEEDFNPLAANHVNWIVQTPFGWQLNYDSPDLRFVTEGRILWGETDDGIEKTTRIANAFGIKTLLKPHVWLRNRRDGKWRSDIEMTTESDWQQWFDRYRTFIIHYATLADELGIEALCIGTELHMTAVKREQDWRRIISEVRKVYHGKLVYAANWYQEFEQIRFWDDLDYIGIQAYFPLADKENPTVEELMKGWQPHLKAIEQVQERYGKPVIFTEIGYRSMTNAAVEPWKWPERRSEVATQCDLRTQATCYEALFRTFWKKPWFAGCYVWKWYPKPGRRAGRRSQRFTPQNKPAELVIAKWYGLNAGK